MSSEFTELLALLFLVVVMGSYLELTTGFFGTDLHKAPGVIEITCNYIKETNYGKAILYIFSEAEHFFFEYISVIAKLRDNTKAGICYSADVIKDYCSQKQD